MNNKETINRLLEYVNKYPEKIIIKFGRSKNKIDAINRDVNEIKEKYILPTAEDYKGAIAGIQRLEDTYLLEPRDIRNGNLSEKYQSRPLTGSFKCFFKKINANFK